MADRKARRGQARNAWLRELQSRPCRRCGADPGHACMGPDGLAIHSKAHATRWNDAMAARGLPFQPRQEDHVWTTRPSRGFPKRKPRPEPTPSRYDPAIVAEILNRPDVLDLIDELEYRRWTGRPGYPFRSLVGVMVTRDAYRLRGWAQARRLVARHERLQEVLRGDYTGLEDVTPSDSACYRFAEMLRSEPELAAQLQKVVSR